MDIKDLRGDDGSFSEDKINELVGKFTEIKGENENLSTKVSQFDEQKKILINDTRNSLLNIGEGVQLVTENFKDGDPLEPAIVLSFNSMPNSLLCLTLAMCSSVL
jgi:hypothetical protein